jgi:hypothetical protein
MPVVQPLLETPFKRVWFKTITGKKKKKKKKKITKTTTTYLFLTACFRPELE